MMVNTPNEPEIRAVLKYLGPVTRRSITEPKEWKLLMLAAESAMCPYYEIPSEFAKTNKQPLSSQ